jgi:hypothetical protein
MTALEAADGPFRLTAPIQHITKLDDGTVLVHCVVTDETPDSQGEIVDYDAAKAAAPDLMKWATLGEMHDPDRMDAGTILKLYFDDAARRVEADLHVVDPVAVRKVISRTYKAVSIGGTKLATRPVDAAGRVFRKITRLVWDEISLVNRGANPNALISKQFVLAKRAQEPDMTDSTDAGLASQPEAPAAPDEARTPEQAAIDGTREALAKAEAADPDVGGGRVRSGIPREDFVFPEDAPGGGFPIASAGDVQDAVSSWGRYRGPHTFEEFKRRLTAIAGRKGYPLPKAWTKESRKMAKRAARAAEAAATPEEPMARADAPETPPEGGDGAKPPFPGAKPPFRGKKAARKARKMAKAAAREAAPLAKKNKTMGALAEALEAVTCAMSEEADEGDTDAVEALRGIADAIQQQLTAEASEPDDGDGPDPEAAIAYAKARRALARRAPRLAKRLGRLRKANGRLRKRAAGLRRERRELRKAAVLTSVLTKSGARNSASDLAKIDAIHAATVELGTTAHRDAPPSGADAGAATGTGSSEAPIAKGDTIPATMREALAGILPTATLEAMEARLAALDERSRAQGEQLAKIAKSPAGGGPATPYAAVFRGAAADGDPASLLEKAAAVIDDPRLKEQVGSAAAAEMIRQARRA